MAHVATPERPLARDPRDQWQLFRHDRLGRAECPYIERWIVDLGPLGSVRLHRWLGDDDQRAHHDHPWGFLTLVLAGSYTDVIEHDYVSHGGNSQACVHVLPGDLGLLCYQRQEDHPFPTIDVLRRGDVRWRPAEYAHTVRTTGAWTLVWTQPKRRAFGFFVRRGGRVKWFKHTRYFPQFGHPPCA